MPLLISFNLLDREACIFEVCRIAFARDDKIIDRLVEKVEIVGEACGVIRGVEHESSRHMAGLRSVGDKYGENVLLKGG